MTEESEFKDAISTPEEIIEDARNGRMFILVDHEERENEGDLVIPAQMATPDAINFMATHGRGLICLALTNERLDALGLPMMASSNSSRHETAFTVSIEAREGVTTGISVHDRAHTIAVAIDSRSTAADIATPGHVFPLRARNGGVLDRAGHTEAAVDISRLAGLNPSGVICEIMNDDGTMARLPDLVSDLIAYRRRYDNLIRVDRSEVVHSEIGGDWDLRVFVDQTTGVEHLALSKGDVSDGEPVLVRMHAMNVMNDVLAINPNRAGLVHGAMKTIADAGRGVLVLFRDVSPTVNTADVRPPEELRSYGLGAHIMDALGISEVILLSNSPTPRLVGLEGYKLSIMGTQPIAEV
jgi:3,4-dihydroxy 2-butanone 4-phosphate synthase/GTP cyclohydrolase II